MTVIDDIVVHYVAAYHGGQQGEEIQNDYFWVVICGFHIGSDVSRRCAMKERDREDVLSGQKCANGEAVNVGEQERSKAAESLRRVGLRAEPILEAFVCVGTNCGKVVWHKKDIFVRHVREVHGENREKAGKLWQDACIMASSFPAENELRKKYKEGGESAGILQRIEGVPVTKGMLCEYCGIYFCSASGLDGHLRRKHPMISIAKNYVHTRVKVPVQRLRAQNGPYRLYRVASEESTAIGNILDGYNPGSVGEEVAGKFVGDREKSTFVSMSRCDERLKMLGLSKKDAMDLVRATNSGSDEDLHDLVDAVRLSVAYMTRMVREVCTRTLSRR